MSRAERSPGAEEHRPEDAGPASVAGLEALTGWSSAQPPIRLRDIGVSSGADPVARADQVLAEGFRASGRPDLPAWPLVRPIDWDADPFGDANWRYQLHAWRMIDPLLAAFEHDGDERYIRDALAMADDWIRFHLSRSRESRFSWYDVAVGLRAAKLAYLIDITMRGRASASEAVAGRLIAMWHVHLGALTDHRRFALNNHGLFQVHGLQALIRVLPQYSLAQLAVPYAEQILNELLAHQFDEAGIHRENSPAYHFLACNQLAGYLRTGWYDDFATLRATLDRALANELWLKTPDDGLVMVGDSGFFGSLRPSDAGVGHRADEPPPPTLSRLLANGYAVIRTEPSEELTRSSMLFFMGAFNTKVHKHPDDLSFTWFDRGAHVLVDSGKYGYHSDRWRRYVRSTRAHNTVEIDESNYSVAEADVYGSAVRRLDERPWGYLLEARVVHRELATEHRRLLLHRPLHWTVVIDELVSDRERSFTQWFHYAPGLDPLPAGDSSFAVELPSGHRLLTSHHARGPSPALEVLHGATTPRVQGWISLSYKEIEPNAAVGATSRAVHAVMVSTFAITRAGESPASAEASLTEDGGIDLRFAGAEAPLRVQGTLDDADSFAVTAVAQA